MGGLDSPAATRSTAAVMWRRGLVKLATATAATSRPKSAAATINAIKSGATTLSSVSNLAASKIAPKTASGSTADKMSAAVSRMRNGNSKRLSLAVGLSAILGRTWNEPVAEPADGQQVDWLVGIDFDLLAQTAHRDPDVGRVGLFRVGPAADEQSVSRDDLAEICCQGMEQARFCRGQLHFRVGDRRRPAVKIEREVRSEHQRLAWDPVAQPSQDALDSGPQLRVVVWLGDVGLRPPSQEAGRSVGGGAGR